MKNRRFNPFVRQLSAATAIVVTFATASNSQAASVYWDIDGANPGSGGATPGGNWEDVNWSTAGAGDADTASWISGDTAILSAGSDATGSFTLNLSSANTIGGLTVQEGSPTISGTGSLVLNNSETPFFITSAVTVSSAITGSGQGINKQGTGTLTLTGANTFNGDLRINAGSVSVAGSLGSLNKLSFGWNNTGSGENLDITAGSNITTNQLILCDWYYTDSTVSQSGGTLNVVGTNDTNSTSASFLLGHWGYGSTCVYGLSGGTLNSLSARLSLGWDRSNVQFNQSGGTANLLGINLNNGRGNSAVYDLSGGRLNLGSGGINNQASKSIRIGNATLGAFGNWTSTKSITLTGTGPLTVDTLDSANGTTARNISLSGGITETAPTGIIKVGAGTLGVAGSISYTGDTVIDGGKFLPGPSLTSSKMIVNAGGSLGAGTVTTAGLSVVGDIELNGGNLALRVGTPFDQLDALSVNVVSASTIEIVPSQQLNVDDEFVVLKYASLDGLGFAGLSPATLPNPHYSASLIDDTVSSQVILKVTGADSLIWTGSDSSTWDVNSTSNWKLVSALPATTSSKFYDSDVIIFDDTSSVGNITLTGDIKPAAITVSNSVTNYAFSGASIGGSASLTKSGTASLNLSGANNFTGLVDIQGGRVITSTATSLGAGNTTVKLGAGATLQATSSYSHSRGLQLTGGAATIDTDSGATLTLTTAFNGGGVLTKTGSGNLRVQGYGGGAFGGTSVVVNGGTYTMAGGAFNSYIGIPSITVNAGASLVIPPFSYHALGGAFTTSPVLNLNGATFSIGQEQYLDAVNLTGSQIVSGGGNPEIRTDYNFNLHTFPSATSSVIGTDVIVRKVNKDLLFTVDEGAAAQDLIFNGSFGTTSTLMTKAGAGTMVIGSAVTYTNTVVSGGTLQIGAGGTTGNLGSGTVTTNASLAFNRSDTYTVSAAIGGTGSVVQNGSGTLVLAGTNTYLGDTIVNSGILEVDGDSLKDSGKLAINNTGVVYVLNTELVESLDIDGVPQAIGTYGPTGSGATFIDDVHFAGFGIVRVTGPGYNAWIGGFGLALGDQDAGDDPDKDGVSNAVEWVVGGNPATGSDVGKLPVATTPGSNFVVSFKRDQDSKVAGTSVAIQVSTTLIDWPVVYDVGDTTATSSGGVTVTDNLDGTDTVTLTLPLAPEDPAKFARLRVTID
jgi:fibronectin-binding autotransporter adhesin